MLLEQRRVHHRRDADLDLGQPDRRVAGGDPEVAARAISKATPRQWPLIALIVGNGAARTLPTQSRTFTISARARLGLRSRKRPGASRREGPLAGPGEHGRRRSAVATVSALGHRLQVVGHAARSASRAG